MQDMYYHEDAITSEKLNMMRQAFRSYDKDGNGVLDRKEVIDLLVNHFKEKGIKKKPTKRDVDDFFSNLDEDHSGFIDFEEFKHFLIMNMKEKLIKPLRTYL